MGERKNYIYVWHMGIVATHHFVPTFVPTLLRHFVPTLLRHCTYIVATLCTYIVATHHFVHSFASWVYKKSSNTQHWQRWMLPALKHVKVAISGASLWGWISRRLEVWSKRSTVLSPSINNFFKHYTARAVVWQSGHFYHHWSGVRIHSLASLWIENLFTADHERQKRRKQRKKKPRMSQWLIS